MKINILSEELRNQIAAGEVIENPSSVIKELVENSIDAKSNKIEISIFDSGLKKIIIKDNGIGIEEQELLKAPLRHATSKINSLNDLYSIKTLGFRGEALASMFSVSKAKIYSKAKNSDKGFEITYENTNEISQKEGELGTTITIEDIFYNTPARKKYLKNNLTEYKNILKIIEVYGYINFNISFKLFHDNKLVFNKPAFKTLFDNIIYLSKVKKDEIMIVDSEKLGLKNIIKIQGICSKYNLVFNRKEKQYLYVNNRFIKSKLLEKAIYDALGERLMGKHPLFVLNIEVDPEIIDVNIHPKKLEIKFENELLIYEEVKKIVKEYLEKNNEVLDITIQKKLDNKFSDGFEVSKKDKTNIKNNDKSNGYENSKNYISNMQKELNIVSEGKNDYDKELIVKNEKISTKIKGPLFDYFNDYRILGQFRKTYILVENNEGLIILDQHVIEEKKYFEEIKNNKDVLKIKLLQSKIIQLNDKQLLNFKLSENVIKGLGYEYGFDEKKSELSISKIPKILNKELNFDIVLQILNDDLVKEDIEKFIYDSIASKACKKSIKGGDELTNYEIRKLIEDLRYVQKPFNCPHGRPILMKITAQEVEKFFKRIV